MATVPDTDRALLSFMIGQVQPFIEAARTVRDLWTGSYLMSWLTAAAMKPIVEKCGTDAFITPHLDDTNPMMQALLSGPRGDERSTLPSLPNKFSTEVPLNLAKELRKDCLSRCRAEWKAICDAVRAHLDLVFSPLHKGWDRYWDAQVDSYLEMRCVVRPLGTVGDDSPDWVKEWDQVGALMEMTRSVRHIPNYRARSDDNRYSGKCSLLGTFEQMGPAEFDLARTFWEEAASPNWPGLHGTRLHSSDRLCAVSLVKRFAWPAYFARTPEGMGKLGVHVHELRYSDSATLAAGRWLLAGERLLPDQVRRRCRTWSGQWLHWPTQENDEDDRCPDEVWSLIGRKKAKQGKPPTYFSILLMDGDRMGALFQGSDPPEWGKGRPRYREITRRLTTFSLSDVRTIVEKHGGELIYAGGDDVLAFLPTEAAVACAKDLRDAFRHPERLTGSASISAGIAVVHYKEDLRFALDRARAAEKAAKRVGKPHGDPATKDALALTVCRRSGEHTTVVLGWAQADLLTGLVGDFRGDDRRLGASDRWAYKLRAELPTLQALPWDAGRAEALRLVRRVEAAPEGFAERVVTLFDQYRQEMKLPTRNWRDADVLDGFVTLCQSAAFLARGRE